MPAATKRRPCVHPACPTITTATRCPAHQPTTAQRGYGSPHQRARADWTPRVAAGQVTCWRCGEPITPDEPWDLGHDEGDTRGPEHANRCNRAAAGRRSTHR